MFDGTKGRISVHCILAALYFILVPLTISTNSASDSFLKLITIPIGLYFVISFVFYKRELKINMVHVFLALYTVCTTLTLFVDASADAVNLTLGHFLNAALFICISVVPYNERELRLLEDIQILLLVFLTAATLLDNVGAERSTLTVFGQESDPNQFVGYFIFPLSVAMKKIFESKYRVFYAVLSAASVYAILLSGSRGGVLAVIVTVCAFAVIYPRGALKKIPLFIVFIFALVLLWILLRPILPHNIVERMSIVDVIESKGTYRGDIWMSMLREIKDSSWELIFGRGFTAKHRMILNGFEEAVVAHNHLLHVLYCQGVIGLITFLTLTCACILRCIKQRKCVSVAIIGMLALSVSLSFTTSTKTFWNLIPYAAMAFCEPCTSYKEEEL